ncbi:MAG: hypothetical protein ABR597_03770 [Bacteroidales bacterium]
MKINRENYEAFFLDFYEGNLTKNQVGELMDFLGHHPDLKSEFESFNLVFLTESPDLTMPGKERMKKSASGSPKSHEEAMIAYFEGDLSEKASSELLGAVFQDRTLQKDFALFSKARLQTQDNISFPGKTSLKKYPLTAYFKEYFHYAAAAAVILFLAGIFFMIPRVDEIPQLSQHVPTVEYETETITPKPEEEIVEIPVKETENQPAVRTTAATRPSQPIQAFSRNIMPEPLDIPGIGPRRTAMLPAGEKHQNIIQREEFKGVSLAHLPSQAEQTEASVSPGNDQRYTTFSELALSGLEKNTGINVEEIQSNISEGRLSFWDVAGAGLAGLSKITGTSLTIDQERDENGRLSLLAIGDKFRIER